MARQSIVGPSHTMSLVYSLVFATCCRSNHHRLALDALTLLDHAEAEKWRDLFLHYHGDYLAGAKAPDEEFKDFRNHVLHVREGEWGGAIEACVEWQKRTRRALSAKDWRQAAWSAGVMSHYFVDPIQPLHTQQSEEENVIHRAFEFSLSKSYGALRAMLVGEQGGFPKAVAPTGEDWLAQMLRERAREANTHYETIIDHYNFDVGVKDPPAGLDAALRGILARMVGLAASGFAGVLARTIEEAQVAAPSVNTNLDALFAALKAPIEKVLAAIDDAGARKEVEAQYAEFRRTGKVRKSLGEDDRVVRALHAAEVLKTPLSALDSRWPREIGTAHAGAGKSGAAEKPAGPMFGTAPAPSAAPEAPKANAVEEKAPRGFALAANAPVEDAPSIGPKTARRLEAVGVHTVGDLLALSPEEGQERLGVRHISAQTIRDWQAQALLACTVPGLRSREAQALVACGVREAGDLQFLDAAQLSDAIGHWAQTTDGKRAWGEAPAPTPEDVLKWILSVSVKTTKPTRAKKKAA